MNNSNNNNNNKDSKSNISSNADPILTKLLMEGFWDKTTSKQQHTTIGPKRNVQEHKCVCHPVLVGPSIEALENCLILPSSSST